MKEINRLKIILAEKNKTGKWLAEQLGKDPSTISKWCSNSSQPPLEMVIRIAELLAVDIKDLIIWHENRNAQSFIEQYGK